jgi:hypothetical protein
LMATSDNLRQVCRWNYCAKGSCNSNNPPLDKTLSTTTNSVTFPHRKLVQQVIYQPINKRLDLAAKRYGCVPFL